MTERERASLRADLSAYLDGQLSAARAERVRRYLAESEEARRLLAELSALSRQLAALPRQQAPAFLASDLMQAARQKLAPKRQAALRSARTLHLFGQLTAAAAVLVGGVLIGWWMRTPAPPTPPLGPPLVSAPVRSTPSLPAEASDGELAATTDTTAGTARAAAAEPVTAPPSIQPAPAAGRQVPMAAPLDMPSTEVVLTAQSAQQYAAAAAILANWGQSDDAAHVADASGRVEQVCVVPATELSSRIEQLAQSVESPHLVQVHLSFSAAASDVLADAGRMAGAVSSMEGERAATVDAPTAEEWTAKDELSAAAGAPQPSSGPAPAQEQTRGRRVGSEAGGLSPGGPPPVGRGAPAAQRRPGEIDQRGPFVDQQAGLPRRSEAREQYDALRRKSESAGAMQRRPDSQPATMPPPEPVGATAVQRQSGWFPAGPTHSGLFQAAGRPVRLRVVLLPPPVAESQPTTAPAADE